MKRLAVWFDYFPKRLDITIKIYNYLSYLPV